MSNTFDLLRQRIRNNIINNDVEEFNEDELTDMDSILDLEKERIELDEMDSKPKPVEVQKNGEIILDYIFTPKQDITTLELARLISYMKMSISSEIYDQIPGELKRHFTKCIED